MPMVMVLVATGVQEARLVVASTTTVAFVAQENLKSKALVLMPECLVLP